MNRDQFNEWVSDPARLDKDSLLMLQQLLSDYPYFQTARILYLLNLKKLNDYRFDQELRRVAIFSKDRGKLRRLVAGPGEPAGKIVVEKDQEAREEKNARAPEVNEHLKVLEAQIRSRLKEIEEGQTKLQQLLEEKDALVGGGLQEENGPHGADKKAGSLRPLPKDDLLEEFIRERKLPGQLQPAFFNPEESARRSIEENEGIISETLARLVAAQGKFDRAIKIYEQLMLKNPQKSSYFAAQIEKLRKEL